MNKRVVSGVSIAALLFSVLLGLLSCAPEGYVPSIKLTDSPKPSESQDKIIESSSNEDAIILMPGESVTIYPSISPKTEDVILPEKEEKSEKDLKTDREEENDLGEEEIPKTKNSGIIPDVEFPDDNEYLLIKNAKIIPMHGDVIEGGDILIKGTKIQKVGKNIKVPKDAKIIDAEGLTALPGLIMESAGGFSEDEDLPFYEFNPLYRAVDGIDLKDKGFDSWIDLGVTTIVTSPSNMLGSQAVAVKTYGKTLDAALVSTYCAQNIEINRELNSTDRIMVAASIREKLIEAQAYIKNKGRGNAQLDALVPLLKRKVPLRISASRDCDVEMLNQIAKEFNLTVVDFDFRYTGKIGNEEAYREFSIDSARMFGIDNRVGSIEKGKDADIILCNGDALVNNNVEPCAVIINGAVVYIALN